MAQPQWTELELTLGYTFSERRRLEQALTHSSLAYEQAAGRTEGDFDHAYPTSEENPPERTADNEQLEFLGDAVLGFIVADLLFHAYPRLEEGDLTRLRAQLVSRRHLGFVGAALALGDFMLLGRGEERSGGRQKSVLLANALEALIAALYLDGGLKATTSFVNKWIVDPYLEELHAELTAGQAMGDHKSALQEWLQAHKAGHPHYTVKAESGPDHRKRFLVELQILSDGKKAKAVIAEGMGSTKKKAEQEAARLAYAVLLKDCDESIQSPTAKVS